MWSLLFVLIVLFGSALLTGLGEQQQTMSAQRYDRLIALVIHVIVSCFLGLFVGWIVAAFTSSDLGIHAGFLGAFLYALLVGYAIFRRKRRRKKA